MAVSEEVKGFCSAWSFLRVVAFLEKSQLRVLVSRLTSDKNPFASAFNDDGTRASSMVFFVGHTLPPLSMIWSGQSAFVGLCPLQLTAYVGGLCWRGRVGRRLLRECHFGT